MAAVSVTFDGQRVIDASTTTNWTAAGSTPTAETDYFYQGGGCISGAVKTSQAGFYYRLAGTTWNFSSPPRVWLAKITATNKDALDGNGLQLEIGSGARSAYYVYNIYSSLTYPIAGGFQVVPIDPNVAGFRSNTVGSPTITAIDMFGVQADFSAISKAPNLGMDAVDIVGHGDGLSLTGGDGADADGTFDSFILQDEGTSNNRWGVVTTREGVLYTVGTLNIGSGTNAVGFTDSNKTVVFPNGRFDTGHAGIKFKMLNASSIVELSNCSFAGRGFISGSGVDTRPDYTVTGTLGMLNITGSVFNTFRNFTAQSQTTLYQCTFLSGSNLYQSSSIITNCVFERAVRSPSQSFLVSNNPGLISDSTFTSLAGTNGHAIELVVSGTYSLSSIIFTNYAGTAGSNLTGSSGNANAAIFNNSGGAVTLNITGGTTPSVRNGAGATTTVSSTVSVTLTGLKNPTEVRVFEAGTTTEIAGQENVTGGSFTFGVSAGQSVDISILSLGYQNLRLLSYSTTSTTSIPISQVIDRQYLNP